MQVQLLRWFRERGRDLPWRKDYSPYSVWVAETMLCQTQVERVIPRYLLWMQRFPDLFALVEAPLEQLLRLWEGLGYYARPRYMQEAAKEVVTTFQGHFPRDYRSLRKLPGIGHYTACAILSIAYNLPYPAIDGNATRVFARLLDLPYPVQTGRAQKRIFDFALSSLPQEDARSFNQAIMDLGALVCVPRNPRCLLCPLQEHCLGFQRNTQNVRPVRQPHTLKCTGALVLFCHHDGQLLIRKRPKEGFLGGLWEFPWGENVSLSALMATVPFVSASVPKLVGEFSHTYCKRRVTVQVFSMPVPIQFPPTEGYHFERLERIEVYPLSSFHRKAFRLFQESIMKKRGESDAG